MRSWLSIGILAAVVIGCRKGPEGPAGPAGPAFSTPKEGYIRGTARVTDTTNGQNRRVTLSYDLQYLDPDFQVPGICRPHFNMVFVQLSRLSDPLTVVPRADLELYIDTTQPPSSPSYLTAASVGLTIIGARDANNTKYYNLSFFSNNPVYTLQVNQLDVRPNQAKGDFTIIREDVTPHDTIRIEFDTPLLTVVTYERRAR